MVTYKYFTCTNGYVLLHQVMAIVVSQDGNVQLAKWRNGIVTCWDLTSQMFISDF